MPLATLNFFAKHWTQRFFVLFCFFVFSYGNQLNMNFRYKGIKNLRFQNYVENKSPQIKNIFILEKKKELSHRSKLNSIPEKKAKQNWTKIFQRNTLTNYKSKWKISPRPKQHNNALVILQT